MTAVLSVLMVLALYFVSFIFIPRDAKGLGLSALFVRFAVSVALSICLMNGIVYYVPGEQASYISAGLILVLAAASCLLNWPTILEEARDHLTRKTGLFLLVGILWAAWPMLVTLEFGPHEGTSNHDDFWYIFVAEWLNVFQITAKPNTDILYPVLASAYHSVAMLPRVGAELLLVFFSVTLGISIPSAYVVVSSIGLILLTQGAYYCIRLFSQGSSSSGVQPSIQLALLLIAPVFFLIFANTNLANLVGLALLAYFYASWLDAIQNEFDWRKVATAGVFLGALTVTYPELCVILAFAVVWAYIANIIKSQHKLAYIRSSILTSLTILGAGFLANSFSVKKILSVYTTGTSTVSHASGHVDPLIKWFHTDFGFLVLSVMSKYEVPMALGDFGALVASVLMLIAIFSSPRDVLVPVFGLLIGSLVLVFYFSHVSYGYGFFKSIEYASLPISILFASGTAAVWSRKSIVPWTLPSSIRIPVSVKKAAFGLAFLLILAPWIRMAFVFQKQYFEVSQVKHLSSDLKELGSIKSIVGDEVVYVDNDVGEAPFFVSRWMAYIMKDVRLVFGQRHHPGGYIFFLEKAHQGWRKKAKYRLARNNGSDDSQIVFKNESYQLTRE